MVVAYGPTRVRVPVVTVATSRCSGLVRVAQPALAPGLKISRLKFAYFKKLKINLKFYLKENARPRKMPT